MLNQPLVRTFIACAHKRSLPPKHTVIQAGDEPQSLYLILEGSVSLLLEDNSGREIVLAYLNPGEFFGESSLFPGQPLDRSIVRTRTPALVAELSYPALRAFVENHPAFMFDVAGQLARRLCDLSRRVADLAFLDVAGRLTHTLLDLSKKPDAVPHPRGVVVRISRTELARHVGCSREMAGRALKKLRDDGLVKDQGRNILIYGTVPSRAMANAA